MKEASLAGTSDCKRKRKMHEYDGSTGDGESSRVPKVAIQGKLESLGSAHT